MFAFIRLPSNEAARDVDGQNEPSLVDLYGDYHVLPAKNVRIEPREETDGYSSSAMQRYYTSYIGAIWRAAGAGAQHVMESIVVFSKGDPVGVVDLPPAIRGEDQASGSNDRAGNATLRDLERQAVARTLVATGGIKRKAAEILGIGLKTLYRKIQEFGLQ